MGLGGAVVHRSTIGEFSTQLPHVAIRNRVRFPVSIKKTPHTAASKGARTLKNGDKYKSLHVFSFAALIIHSFNPLFSRLFS